MKFVVDGFLIVEGKEDVAFLSTFIDSFFLTTNGLEVNDELLNFINYYQNEYRFIVLSDSDEAGNKIRNKINDKIDNIINVYVDINACNKKNKHGVAEASKEEIIKILNPYIKKDKSPIGCITTSDLFNLNLIGIKSNNCRFYIMKKLFIPSCNGKQFLKFINYLNIPYYRLEELALEYYGNIEK